MFSKILIANRGEIACRVAATAHRLGIQTVAVYSDADAKAKHVQACDEAVHVGGNSPKESYLQWQRIIDAAKTTGAQAIHPGYGFLSENEEFAQACADAGLVFIGPPASAIAAMGLKAESKRLMEKASVPLVPGYHGADQDPALLKGEADRIGYPVLIKASAGGGGKGMRIVERTEDFDAALQSCQREAINSFGDDNVLIEKYVQRPRHIEIQVFGDTQGNVVYLFERDCSVQRRHQKVLEEAPAPGMTPALRQQMGEAAVAAAKAVGYVGAGTVEFIVEQPGGYDQPEAMRFYFMEMNTRLQVEHPVTEAITGTDLVEWQLRVAAGEPLPKAQDELQIHGHAIEARINAENPENDFLPATGRLAIYRKPPASSFSVGEVRVDDGVREGDAISPYYDSMIAKLIVHGQTREQALARLDEALSQMHIVDLPNNIQFLRRAIRTDSFAQARLDTALIPREAGQLFGQRAWPIAYSVAAAVASALQQEGAAHGTDPFDPRDGWRGWGVAKRFFLFARDEQTLNAVLSYLNDGTLQLDVRPQGDHQGAPLSEGILGFVPVPGSDAIEVDYAGRSARVNVYRHGAAVEIFAPRGQDAITWIDPLAQGDEPGEGGRLTAPMPGKVVSFAVQAGEKVSKGQALAVMEAMKMEHTIAAPRDGVVAELLFAPGDQVMDGAELLTLADV
ncbi:acetyl/propionyl/methylcrotonyl-CoA carboxylase subunit alpha [Corticibacter populi]|uniref:Acetyl/propionyl/methylcrotonyl-CoA carboxylase subunit alpha n=1 Tax=Corticibacter populi TaxID=1550736 RepID=A0A3M6QLW1_9BURK|nr:acetyl/propionyl/methylcrotonyl-CoA carboxylase subunit alpha [Corticibacter populi]RMX04078.1 acetyl/propionyl/methylcrotonyl-CoA carboxylase subunit alpha [Corticibacter populi]RZS33085.1 3-methylcrotonyl-CoA carboxylase alpha subunit [Corticibacter populi]